MRETWIIAVCNTDCDGVDIYRFNGTEDELKEKLVAMVKDDANGGHTPDYMTENVEEVEKDGAGNWYASATYSDYHIDYSAQRLEDVQLA